MNRKSQKVFPFAKIVWGKDMGNIKYNEQGNSICRKEGAGLYKIHCDQKNLSGIDFCVSLIVLYS